MSVDTGAREPQDSVSAASRRASAEAVLQLVAGQPDTAKVSLFVRELRVLANDVLALAAGVGVPPPRDLEHLVSALRARLEADADYLRWAREVLESASDFSDEGSVAHRASTYIEVLERGRSAALARVARLPNAAESSGAGVGEARPCESEVLCLSYGCQGECRGEEGRNRD